MRRPLVAFMPAHPSQVWVLSPVAREIAGFADILWVVRDKDKSSRIASLLGLSPVVIPGSAGGLSGTGLEFLGNTFRCLRLTRRLGIDLWVTKYGCGNMAGRLLGRRSLAFNDDDADLVPVIAATSYPFADRILAPRRTRMGRFEGKTSHYDSFHELAYLHPARFSPDRGIRGELGVGDADRFVVVRRCAMRAHHDRGVTGIDAALLDRIISTIGDRARVFISAEGGLENRFDHLILRIREDRIHHVLAAASLVVADSQTVAAEASELGVPVLRFSSLAGRHSYLEELREMGLMEVFAPGDEDRMLSRLDSHLANPEPAAAREERRNRLLSAKIDPVPVFTEAVRELLGG